MHEQERDSRKIILVTDDESNDSELTTVTVES